MKYIIVGLGNFGSSLATKLTSQGHEVIGIDIDMDKVERYKESISHTICIDSTSENAVSGLPIAQTDVVLITIGEDQGQNVMVTALFKNLNAKYIISRAINPLHEKVLQALGVDDIIQPENEAATHWAKKLSLTGLIDSFELDNDYSIVQIQTPPTFYGKTVHALDLINQFNVMLLTTISFQQTQFGFGRNQTKSKIDGIVHPDFVIEPNTVLVLFGETNDLRRLFKYMHASQNS